MTWRRTLVATFVMCATLAGATHARGQATQPSTQPSPTTAPATPATTAPSAEVSKLIEGLAAEAWEDRAKALDALIAMGPEIVPQLNAALEKSADPDVRSSLASAVSRIADNNRTGPSIVTLHFDDAPITQVIESIRQQIDAPLTPWPEQMFANGKVPTITIHVDRQPFWTVMQEFLPKAGMRLHHMGRRGLTLMQGADEQMGPACQDGPFMVCASSASRSRTVSYRKNNENVQMNIGIQLMVYVEPKVRVLSRSYQAMIDECVDDAGHALAQPTPARMGGMGSSTESIFNVQVPLQDVPGMTDRLAKLKGYIPVVLLTKSEKLEVRNLAAPGEGKTVDGRTYKVEEYKSEQGRFSVKVSIKSDSAINDGFGHGRGFNFQDIQLFDAADRSLGSAGGSGGGGGEKMEYTLQFAKQPNTGDPVRLVWEIPTESMDAKIPFEFKNLKLP